MTIRAPGGAAEVHSVPGGMVPVVVGDATVGRLYHLLGDYNNDDNEISLFLDRSAPRGTWELTLEGVDIADGRFHAWIERSTGAARHYARFVADDADPTCTTGTICNGLWTIAVGAYDAHSPDRPLAHFSSSGPTRTGMTKPNLAAPGVRVLSCRSHPRGDAPDPPLLTRMSGTSMAAPHVTGTIALMFAAADRKLSITETRRLLLSTTDPPPDTTSGADLLRIGSGYLNTAAAVAAAREAGRAPPIEQESAGVVVPPGTLAPEAVEESIGPAEITADVAGDAALADEALTEAVDWPEADPPPVIEHPLLREGARGAAVHEAQQKLNQVNANQLAAGQPGIMPAPLNDDGIFGPLTRQATVSFQHLAFSDSPRDWDGVIGPKTWQQLDALAVAPAPVPPAPEPPVPPLPVPPPPVPPVVPGLDPPRWRPILTAVLSPQATMRDGNAVRFLIDGPVTYRSMVEAIRSAQIREHYIYLLGWKLVDDFQLIPGDLTTTFRQLTADAAGRGVQIRAMLWAKPPFENRDEVARINALRTGAAIRDDETPNPKPPVFGSHHQKVLVVKGSLGLIGFCGGLDINSDRITVVHPGDPQHDVHCRMEGPAAWDALQTFNRRWVHHPEHGAIDLKRGPLLGYVEPVPSPITTPAPGTSSIPGTCSVAVARTFNPVTRGSTLVRERDIRRLLLQAIANAQRFIYMEDQYLISLEAAAALRAAVPRLQHLTILIAASEISDLPCVWKFRRDFIAALTGGLSAADRSKVRVFDRITPPASRPTFGFHTYVHAKAWVVDDELAVIGSANCNRRGWEHDSEVNAFIFDDTALALGTLSFAQAMRMALWSEHLAVPPSAILDGVAGAALWLTPPAGAAIRPYNPAGGRDRTPDAICDASRGNIDPGLP